VEFLFAFKYLVLFSLLIAVALSLLLWKRPVHFSIIFIVISLLIPLSVWTYSGIDAIMGYAYNAQPPNKSVLIAYIIKNKKIELLMIQPNGLTRLYSVVATKELVKKLKELSKQLNKKRGDRIVLDRKKKLPYTHKDNWTVKTPAERLPPKNETRN